MDYLSEAEGFATALTAQRFGASIRYVKHVVQQGNLGDVKDPLVYNEYKRIRRLTIKAMLEAKAQERSILYG
jgi:hypothetical protein